LAVPFRCQTHVHVAALSHSVQLLISSIALSRTPCILVAKPAYQVTLSKTGGPKREQENPGEVRGPRSGYSQSRSCAIRGTVEGEYDK
jgi:hypothetical protein